MDQSKSSLNPNAKPFTLGQPVAAVKLSYWDSYAKFLEEEAQKEKEQRRKAVEEKEKHLKVAEENKRLIAEHLAAHPEADPKNPWGWSEDGPYADMH
jgi:hypothetical protein